MNYIELSLALSPHVDPDQCVATLSSMGFTGFLEEEQVLKAYLPEADWSLPLVEAWAAQQEMAFTHCLVPEQNWNALWEADFAPVVVQDQVGIRANFHPAFQGLAVELVITPKMSFGTGHHGTTHAMIELMLPLDLHQKTVYDFGTGTGILAILAEKRGAKRILAVDNDDWSIRNAAENILENQCQRIALEETGEGYVPQQSFDLVLANVNRHILEANGPGLVAAVNPGSGILLISGLLLADEAPMKAFFTHLGLVWTSTRVANQWIAMQFNAAQANVK